MNDQLKPEIATSYEACLDMKFLNNRLGFDFTYYTSRTKNQIMKSFLQQLLGVVANG